MSASLSPGKKFREVIKNHAPIQIPGVINAYNALLAKRANFHAIYLSGSGVACASYGLPDLGVTALEDVLIDARRITSSCELPLLVDIDTGWGGAFNIARTIKESERAGIAAVHIEDQVQQKRCGHRPNKELVSVEEMCDRIKAAVDARTDENFVIMVRTDAFANEGHENSLERCLAYKEVGADMIFPEALHELGQYKQFKDDLQIPILANITENGQTPLFSVSELQSVGVDIVLYPLTAFRAMSKTAENVYQRLHNEGTQAGFTDLLHHRQEVYDVIDYHSYEQKLNELFSKEKRYEQH